MTLDFNKIHNRFRLNGNYFENHEALKNFAYNLIEEGQLFEKSIGEFLIDWLDSNEFLYVNTSGSTGKPKQIKLYKQAMVNSAIATGLFFDLKPGCKVMNCLPSHYIAGKMMLVRALILGFAIDCVEPAASPVFDYQTFYDFSAMVPLQLEHSIDKVENIKTIIIGGSKVSKQLQDKIKKSRTSFYETYGMTETATHIALKPLESISQSGDDFFTTLPNVLVSQDVRACLVINAPKIMDSSIVTNDIVELKSNTSFKWLGRFDNVINSGGVKLFPEQIEVKLQTIIEERFIVASEPDEQLGEKLILIIENPSNSVLDLKKQLKSLQSLAKYEVPKNIYTINSFIETSTRKIHRRKTIKSVLG